MRIFRRLAFIGFSLSLVFFLKVFHKLGRIMDGRDSSSPSLPAKLADSGEDSDPAQPAPQPRPLADDSARPAGPASLSDTNSGRTRVKVSKKENGSIEPKQGSAVLVDSMGRRYEVRSALPSQAERAKSALARLPALNVPPLLPEEGGLDARKRRASILLLGTALGAVAAVLFARRKFFPD